MTPVISTLEDLDSGVITLVASSYGKTEPCGERLFRSRPHPIISFEHTSEVEAKRDAAILQEYVNAAWSGKVNKTKGQEEKAAPVAADLSGAWWNL